MHGNYGQSDAITNRRFVWGTEACTHVTNPRFVTCVQLLAVSKHRRLQEAPSGLPSVVLCPFTPSRRLRAHTNRRFVSPTVCRTSSCLSTLIP